MCVRVQQNPMIPPWLPVQFGLRPTVTRGRHGGEMWSRVLILAE